MLHMLCGKVPAGKSTVAAQDPWIVALYPEELRSIADYVRLVPRLRAAMGPHVAGLLRAGVSLVLDWPANTRTSRAWRPIFEAADSAHRLHLLDALEEVCLALLSARNAGGQHEYQVSDAEFADLARHFERPTPEEGFDVLAHPVQ